MARFRDLKSGLRGLLSAPDWRARLAALDDVPARRLPGPLFSLLLDREEPVRWRAAEVFGLSVARLAESAGPGEGLEAARVVLRQCLWRLNEESGGLGWGIPEALGATLARHRRLATEFHRVLASYVRMEKRGEGNYLEHAGLRRGVFWALGRLARAFPDLVAGEEETLRAGLADEDRVCAGLAARALGLLPGPLPNPARVALVALGGDDTAVDLYEDGEPAPTTVGALARAALERR